MTTSTIEPRAVDADQAPADQAPDTAQPDTTAPAATAPETEAEAEPTAGGFTISELRERLAASPSGKLVIDVHPDEVTIGYNVRKSQVSVKKRTINSVKEHGFVQEPPAYINADGRIEMIAGQRRILAAREAGVEKVSIVLKTLSGKDADAIKAAKIEAGLIENEDREGMTSGDVLSAVEDYLDLPGITPAKAGRKLGIDAAEARAVKALRKSERARTIAADGQLTFRQAEALMEFEGEEAAEKRLFTAAGKGTFTAEVAKLREERHMAAERAKAAESYTARGFTILEAKPSSWYGVEQTSPLDCLYRKDGSPASVEDITDPKQWAVYLEPSEVENPEGGMDLYFEPVYYCTEAKAAGLKFSRDTPHIPSAEEKERKRADNRIVLAGNKYARAATENRRKFEAELLAKLWGRDGKTAEKPPAGLLAWAAKLLFTDPGIINENNAIALAAELLGVKEADITRDGKMFADMTDPRAAVMLIGLALGSLEARMQRPNYLHPDKKPKPEYWRVLHPQSGVFWTTDLKRAPREMIAQLRKCETGKGRNHKPGYQPTPLELALLGEMTLTAALEAEAKAEVGAAGTLTDQASQKATAKPKPTATKATKPRTTRNKTATPAAEPTAPPTVDPAEDIPDAEPDQAHTPAAEDNDPGDDYQAAPLAA
ncbi:ParB/RepB/Spo0J family partition protein [Nocardia amamiensis]|uniref:ParB/RepB/Spo0J family partition protein n=1 Tax=Nocardia amamiensis TaxID=404578 RepID=UPI00082DD1D4|nr:ParB/RepB/Spo0J family partition protein [Nocardia amamiensis]